MSSIGLASLIHPRSPEDFFSEAWPKDEFVVHGLSESVRPLTELPFLQSLDSLLKFWSKPIQVHLPDVKDESSSIYANSEDAKKLFSNGMALLFNNAHELSPVLIDAVTRIGRDLGLPASTHGRCMIYATPDGKGTAPHFDQNINFVLQLHGTKTWKIASNTSVENPTQRFTMGQELDPEIASYAYEEMPTEMPEDAQEIVLKPGSMLFVPRGHWHSTEASGEALALNFTFSQPTWVDLLTAALRSRLLLSPEWRELADGVSSEEMVRRFRSHKVFESLLQEVVADLPNWRASDILNATEGWDPSEKPE